MQGVLFHDYLLPNSQERTRPERVRLLTEHLENRGHRVLTPAFRISETDKGAAWHAETLVEELSQSTCKPSEVVCVAHSAGGMFLVVCEFMCRTAV